MKNLIIICLLVFALNVAKAAPGCLVGDRMYTSFGVNILSEPIFSSTTYIDGNGKCWSGASGMCKVCDGSISVSIGGLLVCLGDLFGPKTGNVYDGEYFASYTIVDCSIDDYSWVIILVLTTFGGIIIRRSKHDLLGN